MTEDRRQKTEDRKNHYAQAGYPFCPRGQKTEKTSRASGIPALSSVLCPLSSETGMAVIMALLLIALAASAAALSLWQQGLWWQHVEANQRHAQIRLMADAQLAWASAQFLKKQNVVTLEQAWAQATQIDIENNIKMRAQLSDMQGRLNLNALARRDDPRYFDKTQVDVLRRLFLALHLPVSAVDTLLKWQGLTDKPAASVNQNSLPSSFAPPIDEGRRLERLDSLNMIAGFTPNLIAKLEPYISVLQDTSAKINVNTAPALLLAAYFPALWPEQIAMLIKEREKRHFTNAADVINRLNVSGATEKQLKDHIVTTSSFFQLDGEVRQGPSRYATRALLKKVDGGVKVIWRHDQALTSLRQS